ncbi:HAMP domain-containing sensor histidine kinase [Nonomuraea sp. NEAU-A123]|uniref:sensor histidine kinase n=1 Tax=Nonomuraea sp. NEAU-A123 TaxID=2839649 RepID=UPI001BE4C49D|nr:HAMP domain-containing sensor histidine kinase [Nonomuraea sp. NEAU-A123]MBT2233234.1 HAMP domain-containing histidine kinase [Nonomuraea sp. NEAU-A123]
MKLSTRFALCLAVAVPLLVALAGLVLLGLVSQDLRAERDDQLTARLRALTPMAATFAWRTRVLPAIPPDFLQQRLTAAAGVGGVCVVEKGEKLLVIGDVPGTLPVGAGPADHVEGERRWRFVAADVGRQRTARLILFEPEERLGDQIAVLGKRLVSVTLVAAGVGAVAGLVLGRFAVRPLSRLGRQARTIGRQQPPPRTIGRQQRPLDRRARTIDTPSRTETRLATTAGVAEIDELARLLNDLLDRRDAAVTRTGEALETARAFAATAAHELRTPLTSMGTNLTLLDHPELDPADRAEIITDLAAEHGRIQRLITMLRRLARGELLAPDAFADTDLTEIINDAVEDARHRHPHATITARLVDGVRVRGWAEGLRMVADNLLDNAALHGADGSGRVAITVTLEVGEEVVLAVQDAGSGVVPRGRDAMFVRFRRRSGSPGSGLGLTLVRQQATLHGGTATLGASLDGPGTRAEVRLPLTGRQAPGPGPSWLE